MLRQDRTKVPLGERGHDLRVLSDEGGVDASGLNELTNQLVKKTSGGVGRRAFNAKLLDLLEQVLASFCDSEQRVRKGRQRPKKRNSSTIGVEVSGHLDTFFLQPINHGYPPEGRGEIDRHSFLGALAVWMVNDLVVT